MKNSSPFCQQKSVFIKRTYLYACCLSLFSLIPFNSRAATVTISEKLDIAQVWAGHPVNFAIKTAKNFQCVTYYNTNRKMVIASRPLSSSSWKFTELPTTTGWDSHNYIDIAIDDSGYIHISGNMHNVSLIYFRSKKPWNTDSFESPGMIGSLETSVTYPEFIEGPNNLLYFQYRIGGSGNGTTICNGYSTKTKKWTRITSNGLFDGENQVSAYHTSPVYGPDNFFHIIWMWRETPVANTNFHISHMKSSDLINWQTMSGKSVSLPVKTGTSGVIVDPIGSKRGLINMDYWISWDKLDRAVVTYHRYDDFNISQIFNTRYEDGNWKIHQTSSWKNFKWNLDREGSLTHDIAASPLSIDENGELVQDYVYPNQKLHRWVLNNRDLKPESDKEFEPPQSMKELYQLESTFPGMQVNRIQDGEFYLKWESMPINQDKSRPDGTYPASSTLRLYKFSKETDLPKKISSYSTSFKIQKNRSRITIHVNSPQNAQSGPLTASVFSIDGKLVFKSSFLYGACVIPVRNFTAGIYMLRVVARDKSVSDAHKIYGDRIQFGL